MGVRTIVGRYESDPVALYDSVTGFAFGPVLSDEDEAEDFLEHVRADDGRDPREIPVGELELLLVAFRKNREARDEGGPE